MAKLSLQKLQKILLAAQENNLIQILAAPKELAQFIIDGYNKASLTNQEQDDAQLFNNILNQERLAKSVYTNIKTIGKGTSQYTSILKILPSVNKFTELYSEGQKHIGYHEYIKLGLSLMGNKYALTKFNYFDDKIFEYRECQRVVQEDNQNMQTLEFQRTWDSLLQKEFGTIRNQPINQTNYNEFVNFVWGREQADDNNAAYANWIMAQIEGLRFLGEPFITSIHGDKATQRYMEFKKTLQPINKVQSKQAKILERIKNFQK